MTAIGQLQQAIAAQEGLRGTLPDEIIEATIAALQKQLDELQATAVPEQQRKQVTVLFADVAGFTAMSETLDAELVTGIMNEVWSRLDAEILAHNGRIDKHIGDAVMALWGADTAREDDAEQAIRAALAMQAALAEFAARSPHPIAMRIGLNTGPVLLGQVGQMHEFTAMGDTVNLASRLETAAAHGAILVSHNTYSQVRGVFDVHELEPITVKGKAEPVQVYEIERAKPRAFRLNTRGVEGVETRMIGREREFSALQEAFVEVLEGSQTRLVTVVGEAGVGKSRLLYEFDNWLELRPEVITYFKGRASADLQKVAHSIFRDMFAARFDIRDSDSTAVALAKFRSGFTAVSTAAQPLSQDQADITGHWLGFDFSSSTAVSNLLGTAEFATIGQTYLSRYFRTLTGRGPVAVLLEDIHWADDQSLDLVTRLFRAIPQAQLLLLALTRPSLFERRPSWGAGEPLLKRIDLLPLSKEAGRALVDEILQRVEQIPAQLRETVVGAAEGNPFYTEELVKMFIDQGVIVRGEAGQPWRVEATRLAEATVPPTLIGLLQARLDGLPLAERDLLQRAAVVGRLFWDGVVADLAQTPQADLRPALEAVRDRELIFQREHSAFAGSREFVFKHNLLRDVAYERVLLKYRQEFHGRVARWLEEHAGERLGEYLSLIAGHYQQAGEEERAAVYLLRAGNEARRASAFSAARDAYERVLALAPQSGAAVEAAVYLAEVCRLLGDLDAAETAVALGLSGARTLDDRALLAEALVVQALIVDYRGDIGAAIEKSQEALTVAREVGGPVLGLAVVALGGSLWEIGRLLEAEKLAEEGLLLARQSGDTAVQAMALNLRANIVGDQGYNEEAIRRHEENVAFARATGNLEREGIALLNLGSSAMLLRNYRAAREHGRAALLILRDIGHGLAQSIVLGNLAETEAALGDIAAARRAAAEALRLAHHLHAPAMIEFAVATTADVLAASGERARALEILCLLRDTAEGKPQLARDLDEIFERLAAPPAELAQARAVARQKEPQAVVAELLAEAKADPTPYS